MSVSHTSDSFLTSVFNYYDTVINIYILYEARSGSVLHKTRYMCASLVVLEETNVQVN